MTIWEETFQWDIPYITHEIRHFAYLYKESKFVIHYQIDSEVCKEVHFYKNGLLDRLKISLLNTWGDGALETYFEGRLEHFFVEVAFAFQEYSVDRKYIDSYVNDQCTVDHGTHVDGIVKGITDGVRMYFAKNNLKGVEWISESNLRENLIIFMNIRMKDPVYAGSVKNELLNEEIVEPISLEISNLMFEKLQGDTLVVRSFERRINELLDNENY